MIKIQFDSIGNRKDNLLTHWRIRRIRFYSMGYRRDKVLTQWGKRKIKSYSMGYRKDKLLIQCLAIVGKKVRFNSLGIEEDDITKTFAHLSLSSWLIEITTFTHSF